MDSANDNEAGAALPKAEWDSVLPPELREMLDQCDRVGIGMDLVMNVFRARLYEAGFDKTDRTERILTAFWNVIERHR
ncbi:MAG: hypothetical protein EOO77_36535 [Oxalobacteraceae bacterium]|nr:MAG: hypothetical protein EOO77_36535 [Oxalobacteraceae bacterium]